MVIEISGIAFQYSHTIGRGENVGEGFLYPVAIARGQGDRIYVVSRGSDYRPIAKRITICTVGEEYVGEFGKGVLTPQEAETFATLGPLLWPTSIALDKEGKVYVADEWLNWISIFTPDGQFLGRWGKPGDEHGEINRPAGITFDQDDHLYIVDSLNNRIQVFTKGGKFLAEWGRAGWGDGEFNLPWGIDIDHNGNVYVADWHNERIQKFTADGRFLMKFGSPGTGEGEFNQPTAVAVDKDGIIYVTDWGNERLQVFGPDGSLIAQMSGDATISKWGKRKLDANPALWRGRAIAQELEQERLFFGPIAVDVDDAGLVFVAETGRSRIQVYRKLTPFFRGSRL